MTEPVVLGRAELDELLEAAARRGAEVALKRIGLGDDCAAADVVGLRELLRAWRDTRKTARRTLVTFATRLLLIAILAGVAIKTGWIKQDIWP